MTKCSKCNRSDIPLIRITLPDGDYLYCKDCFKKYEKKIKESFH